MYRVTNSPPNTTQFQLKGFSAEIAETEQVKMGTRISIQ
jgi:hypothetical protein